MPPGSRKARSYTDDKGRKRWRRNDEIADIVRDLGNFLIIGGYPYDHAVRYGRIAHSISRWPELIDDLADDNRLNELPGVGGTITEYLCEIIVSGDTAKFSDDQYGPLPPRSVLELTRIERLGAKTARVLYHEHGIDSLDKLCKATRSGSLDKVKGIGPKMRQTILAHCEQ